MKIKLLVLLTCSIILGTNAFAQTHYSASYTTAGGNPGGLNTDLDEVPAGWTSIISASISTNQWSASVPVPFPFEYFGNPVTELKASANGLVSFSANPSLPNDNENLPSASLPDSTIACFWDAFTSNPPTASNDIVVWKVWGTAPNRQLWIKWISFEIGSPSVNNATFACVLEETTNNIYLVEGAFTVSATTATSSVTAGIQLNAGTAVQYWNKYRQRVANTTAIIDNNYVTFTPYVKSNMAFVSATTDDAQVDNVSVNSTHEAFLRVTVNTSGELNPLLLTHLDFNTSGTTTVSDLSNAKVFYTGNDSNYSTARQFGSTVSSPSGIFSVTGSQQLPAGNSYFWLAYSISNAAAPSNLVDAECTQLTVGGVTYTPFITAPTGSRTVSAGLSGTHTVGTGGNYTYLSDAFKAINADGLSGDLTLSIITDIDDTAAASLSYTGSYKISIVPSDDVLRNITARFYTPFVEFKGSSNVVIDGKGPVSGTGKYLRFVNRTDLGATFSFINGCDHDTIRNTIIEGAPIIQTVGVVTIGASGRPEGNHHLAFMNNDVRDRSDSLGIPAILFYSAGLETAQNNSITISNNNLFNYRRSGVYVSATGNGGNWNISDNSFYYNAATTPAGGDVVSIMLIAGNMSNNNLISNNYFGGRAPLCGGSAWVCPNAVNFVVMNLNAGIDIGTSVQGNTIQNISLTGGASLDFAGIRLESGRAEVGNIRGNLIGHPTTPNSILNNMRLTLGIYGFLQGLGEVIVANNTLANLNGTGTSSTSGVRAICFQGGGAAPNIHHNTVYNITSSGTQTGPLTSTLMGIGVISGAEAGSVYIGNNNIYNLTATAASANVVPSGIIVDNITANGIIEKNTIYGINTVSSGSTAFIHGLYVVGPVNNWTVRNNMISLTNGTNTNGIVIRGISDNASGNIANYFYNTVYIGGNAASGALNSFAFERRNAGGIATLRNNIFYNGRTGGTGVHAAIANVPSVPATNWTANTSGYNLLVASAPSQIGAWSATILPTTFAAWQSTSGGDYTSWSDTAAALPANLFFKDVTNGNLAIDSSNALCWYANGKGIALSGTGTDIHGQSRSVAILTGGTDLGADEFPTSTQPIAAYVSGNIAATDSSTFTFAGRTLGKVYWNSGAFSSSVTCRYHSGETPQVAAGQSGALFNSYTEINGTGGGTADFDVKLMYDSALFGTVSGTANIATAYTGVLGNTWTSSVAAVDYTERSFRSNNQANFGFFTGTDLLNPVPVKLMQFTAQLNKANTDLYWSTASEINSKGFFVERAAPGGEWKEIGFVKGKGNSNLINRYTYTDVSPFTSGISRLYYRLRITDNDGSFEYSKVVAVEKMQQNGTLKTELYPNPAQDGTQLFITSPEPASASVIVADLQGKIITEETINLQQGINAYAINAGMNPGVYLVKVTSNGSAYHTKLIKQ